MDLRDIMYIATRAVLCFWAFPAGEQSPGRKRVQSLGFADVLDHVSAIPEPVGGKEKIRQSWQG